MAIGFDLRTIDTLDLPSMSLRLMFAELGLTRLEPVLGDSSNNQRMFSVNYGHVKQQQIWAR